MLALQHPQQRDSKDEMPSSPCRCTPNILPCRIHHEGPVDSTLDRYWIPTPDGEGDDAMTVGKNGTNKDTQTAYFRGRRLKGRRVPIPDGYQGILATSTDRTLPQPEQSSNANDENDDDDEDEEDEPVKIIEKTSTFDDFVVWSHERLPDSSEDPFIKGVEEWIRFAEVIHSNPESDSNSTTKATSTATSTLASRNKAADGETGSS